jgi:hypothetical protein
MRTVESMAAMMLFSAGCVMELDTGEPDLGPVDAPQFDRVENESAVDLELVHDVAFDPPYRPWELTCMGADPNRIRIERTGDTLRIRAEDPETGEGCVLKLRAEPTREILVGGNGDLTVAREIRGLTYLEARGDGAIDFQRGLVSDELTLEALGNGQIRIEGLDVRALFVDVAGRGDLLLSGQADLADLRVTGIGDVSATSLRIRNLYVELSGAGDAAVWVTDTIDGVVRGEGNLDVWGDPDGEVDQQGAGHVNFHGSAPPAG